ncbi:MAG TPA: caleosin family protein [Vicinamibacterales bacterium]|nr:caleosin family protein [Vicinamibacterales bacterium]
MFDLIASRHVIVHAGRVYADLDGDGRIGIRDEAGDHLLGPRRAPLLEAAAFIARTYDVRMPGAAALDGTIVSDGALDAAEQRAFESEAGTPRERSRLAHHLSFFDRRNRGRIGFGDSYRGWRALRFGIAAALVQTAGTALVFGRRHGGTIVIAEIDRPSGTTGVYDRQGNIDRAQWEALRDACARAATDGVLTTGRLRAVIAARSRLGRVPARQFETFFRVCRMANGRDAVTLDQLAWLYDGTLLYRVAARPHASVP